MTITPRFNATIDADISKFMQKAATVNKTMQKMASEVIVDIGANISEFMTQAQRVQSTMADINNDSSTVNINANTTDLQAAIAEARARLAELNSDTTININGDSSNFNNAANSVNRQTNSLSRRVTEARIKADIGGFESRMVKVARALAEAGETVTPAIELEIGEFSRDILQVQDRMREIARTTADPQVEADIGGFMAQMALVQAQLANVTETHDIDIRADTGNVTARLALLRLQLQSFAAQNFVVRMKAVWNDYQAVMGKMAAFSRNFGEMVGMTARGIGIFIAPAIVPVLASVVGLLGQLGPMLGVIAGSSFALLSSFGAAGIGVAGFAAVAVPSIGKVVETSKELEKLEEKLAKADTWKERNKIMQEQQAIMDGMSDAQVKAGESLNTFKDNYSKLVKSMETPVLEVFSTGLTAITGVLDLAKPMIENVTGSIKKMIDSFNANLEAADVKDFFNFLSTSAGPALEAIGGAVGNFTQGLFNMMAAFGPLSTETQNSFLKMSESFRSWTDGLSESEKFNQFVDYVSTNMPKIRSIFSDAIQGMINTFAAFGPSSATMMSGLQDMMERFKAWSAALGESQGFRSFIDYIQTNGPVVVSTIGEIVTFITNLGIAAAPIGQALLGMVNGILAFTNGLMEAHPWLGKVAVVMTSLTGIFLASMPVLVGLNALTDGFIATLIKMGGQALIQGARVAAGWLIAIGPIGWVTIAVAGLAVLIYKYWDEISAFTSKAWTAVSTAISNAVNNIMTYIQTNFPAIYRVIQTTMDSAKTIISTVWNAIKGTFSNVLAYLKALVNGDFSGMKDAVSRQMELMKSTISKIWDAVKSHFNKILPELKNIAQRKFAEMGVAVAQKMSEIKEKISAKWEEAKSATVSKLASLVSTAMTKFAEMVSKVAAKMSEVKTAIANKWEEAKSATASKLASLLSAAGTIFSNLVSKVREKMSEAVSTLGAKVAEMPGKVLSYVGAMVTAGGNLIQGLIDGAVGMASTAINSIKTIAGDMVDAALSYFKIKSPSRVFMEIGAFVGQGLALGVSNTKSLNEKVMNELGAVMTNAAKVNAAAIKAIEKTAANERAAENKKHAATINKIESDAEDSVYAIKANAKAKKRKLTTSESLRIEKIHKDSAYKIEKEETSHSKKLETINKNSKTKINAQEVAAQKESLAAIQTFVDNKNKLGELSAVQEAEIWRKASQSFKAGTQEKIDAQAKYQDSMTKINDSLTKSNEEYLGKTKAINDSMIAEEKRLTDAYQKSVDDRAKSLYSFTGLFDEMKTSFVGTGESLINNLKGQVDGFKDWSEDIAELSKKGIEEGLLEELRAMGPAAYGEIAALNSLSAGQLAEYESLWKEKTGLARSQALTETEGLRVDTEKQIDELKKVSKKQLEVLRIDWIKEIQEITGGTKKQFSSLTQIGKDSVTGLMNGMKSMKGPLMAEAKSIADSVQQTIKSALQIHSPSRVLEALGQFAGQGLVNGLSSTVGHVIAASQQLADAIAPNVQMAGIDIRSDIADMKQQIRQELEVNMNVSHSGSVGSNTAASGGDNYYITVDAKNVREFNDVVRLFDKQKLRQK
ncbi:hypothetical protein FQ085_11580 [Planococcus sp. ANT_H30]|uniref:phage tail protein n=1 Tax=Planococcus sp. ANT_H30 TaxID=2597347 RepID=UPI0011EFED66|nr:hypothetical protein [Planococcus sp. ANT_H30]KAA0956627.1 hypothetical protein FQ085_11580 [Planococcus sp. ANT_H30]